MGDHGNVLCCESGCADAVPIGPALIGKSAEEIAERVIPSANLKFAGAAARRKSLRIECNARKEGLRKGGEQNHDGKPHTDRRALNVPQDAQHFSLAPGGSPYEGQAANKDRSDAPKNNSARATEQDRRNREPEDEEDHRPASLVTKQKIPAESENEEPRTKKKISLAT